MLQGITDEGLLKQVEEICRKVFGDPGLVITASSSAGTVAQWDSMTNLILIDELENKFNVKFSLDDILDAQNIGDLCTVIKSK